MNKDPATAPKISIRCFCLCCGRTLRNEDMVLADPTLNMFISESLCARRDLCFYTDETNRVLNQMGAPYLNKDFYDDVSPDGDLEQSPILWLDVISI